MNIQPTKIHQKLISFPDPIYSRLLKRAKRIGFSFSEYMRMMSVEHLKSPEPFEEIETLDTETSKSVEEGLEDMRQGRFTHVKSSEELKKFLSNL